MVEGRSHGQDHRDLRVHERDRVGQARADLGRGADARERAGQRGDRASESREPAATVDDAARDVLAASPSGAAGDPLRPPALMASARRRTISSIAASVAPARRTDNSSTTLQRHGEGDHAHNALPVSGSGRRCVRA